jgi:hypothetical protein
MYIAASVRRKNKKEAGGTEFALHKKKRTDE